MCPSYRCRNTLNHVVQTSHHPPRVSHCVSKACDSPPTHTRGILPALPHAATTSKITTHHPADSRDSPAAPFPRQAAQPHARSQLPPANEEPLDTHGGGPRRAWRPAEGSLEPFLPQGLVLGEVAGQLQKGVGAPALRLHQLPHSHGARHGRRQTPPGCTWPRGDTGPTSGGAPRRPLRQPAHPPTRNRRGLSGRRLGSRTSVWQPSPSLPQPTRWHPTRQPASQPGRRLQAAAQSGPDPGPTAAVVRQDPPLP